MNSVHVVTGYRPLPILNMSEQQYRNYGLELQKACVGRKMSVFDQGNVDDCWAYEVADDLDALKSTCEDPPADRFPDRRVAALSAVVNLQKTEWLETAHCLDDGASDFYVWIDYGIFKQGRGIDATVVRRFLDKIVEGGRSDAVVAPGELDLGAPMDWRRHYTRWCGSVYVVPRDLVYPLNENMQMLVRAHMGATKTVSYDVNYMAVVETLRQVPFRQYRAWWDHTQFSAYEG